MGAAPAAGPAGTLTMLADVRPPAAAGSFYPADRAELARSVDRLLVASDADGGPRPAGLIVPHAGYRYSGKVAAAAYGRVRARASEIRRVMILGPAHFAVLDACATTSGAAWRTPLGDVLVDDELRETALATGLVQVDDRAHADEHAVEVQLPFLQPILGERMRFLPLAVGDVPPADVAAILGTLEPAADLFVVSTDLSHYEDAEAARRHDDRTIAGILARDPDAIGPYDACGRSALRGALSFARVRGFDMRLLSTATSADAGADPNRVVGYASFAIAVDRW
jgi:MEMO1 family protein